ncbi:MFS transporter [Leptothoe spongobia]|uniref:MFS transporter n=1 Tax=Leptothoe spongobia TAU-MAC 1115 TaxID=1967444 RepID=A0A947DD59_9CYAN|nr:MFS transporter [Leptothoe spongobia]MBT9314813.1 MFS transporter [Leptothoe spongobia TAU-MAC 1115]
MDEKQRTLVILISSILIDFIGVGIVIPLLPFYAQTFNASALEVGILLGLFPLMGILAPTLWGNLSDRIGRRPALLFNIAGTTLSYLWLGLANSLWMLYVARILAGASSASITIAQSYVADLTTTDRRTKLLSFLDAASAIGIVLGLVIGGLLVGSNPSQPNFQLPAFAATTISGLTFGLALMALPQFRHRTIASKRSLNPLSKQFFLDLKKTLQRPLVGVLMTMVFAILFATTGVEAIFALWCEQRLGWGPQQFSILIVLYFLAIASLQIGITEKLAHSLGETKLLLLGLCMLTLGLILLPFSNTILQLVGSMMFFVMAEATATPTLTSLLSRLSGAQQQGKTLGLMQSVSGIGGFFGSIGAGFVFGYLGANWPYWISAILMLIGTFVCWTYINQTSLLSVMHRRRRQKSIHLFKLLDHNNNGTLELTDFQQAGQNLAKLRGWSPKTTEYEVLQVSFSGFWEMLQRLADRDGNQRIDLAEWLHRLDQQIDNDFSNFFLQVIDTNQDGQMVFEELQTFYQAYGINTDDFEDAFHSLDLNQDGHISQKEFETLFAQFLYSDDVQAPGNWIFGVSLPRQL